DGGYFASGKTFGSVYFVQNASSSSSAPGLFAVTAELGSSSSLGADLVFKVGLSGQVSPTSAISMRLYSNGDVRLGATGVALATNATSGFVHIP
ncbi:hypothetical protein ACE4Z6_26870, partial [Salmonella enterica]|uniref:hypothetical protein n=1 Tax=Salmonella enterica TaxID=28901 RepID=UPI003D2D6F5C